MNSSSALSFKAIIIVFGILFSFNSFAQKDLDRNPVFSALALAPKAIDYPRTAILSSMYGRIYTKFHVNHNGKIENVEVFYPRMTTKFENSVGFGASIRKGLKKLPLLGLGYEGDYILPVAFEFTNYSETPQVHYPTNQLPEFIDIKSMTLLTEIKVSGKSNRYTKPDFKSGFETALPSQQIAD